MPVAGRQHAERRSTRDVKEQRDQRDLAECAQHVVGDRVYVARNGGFYPVARNARAMPKLEFPDSLLATAFGIRIERTAKMIEPPTT